MGGIELHPHNDINNFNARSVLQAPLECTVENMQMTTCLYTDHLSIETTVCWPVGHISDSDAPLYKDHLSTKTVIT